MSALGAHAAKETGYYWIIDDAGFPKKRRRSVGVARQYCGQLGKQDNCQVAVSLSIATQRGSLPIAWQLYVPKEWIDDRDRLGKIISATSNFDIRTPLAAAILADRRRTGTIAESAVKLRRVHDSASLSRIPHLQRLVS